MRPRLDLEGERLMLTFAARDTARANLAEVRAAGGLQVTLDRRLSQYDVADVHLDFAGRTREAFKSYVARTSDSGLGEFVTAFVLQDWSRESEQELESKEILRIAKSAYATGAILQRIAGDSRWGKNQEILAAIVRNPKSPTLVVTRLLDKLRTSDLRTMAKMSSGLREIVRKNALREYMKRSGQ